MSGLFGSVQFDDGPDRAVLERFAAASSHRGPDGSDLWLEGAAGLGCQRHHTTPESVHERLPLDDGRFVLTFDGRLDNPEELRAALGRNEGADAELVLRAVRTWGNRAPERLVGDFAFAIWDRKERELLAARDFLGVRPFYFFWEEGTFLFASEIATLLADDRIPRTLNEGMIAEHLAARITNREETLYSRIRRLPPGHLLRVSVKGLRVSRWFGLEPRTPLRYGRDEEYQEHLRSLLLASIRARMRSAGPVGAYLSGGLDSSSVVATAASLGKVSAYSISFPGRECDETRFIEELRRKCDLPGEVVPEPDAEFETYVQEAERRLAWPGYPNGAVFSPLDRCARRDGIRVVLTGFGGDEWFIGAPPPRPLDWLRRLRPRRMSLPEWIHPEFAARVALSDRLNGGETWSGLLATFASGAHVHALEMQDLAQARAGLELRHPLSDRRLVEFALAIPESQRRRGRVRKFILREAMRGVLPELIRADSLKADFSHLFAETLRLPQARERLLGSLSAVGRGWIEARKIVESYNEMIRLYARQDPGYQRHVWPLWMVLAFELFLEATRSRALVRYA